jgi:hypothetical protein
MTNKCYYCDKEAIQKSNIYSIYDEDKKQFNYLYLCLKHKIEKDIKYIEDEITQYTWYKFYLNDKDEYLVIKTEEIRAIKIVYEGVINKYVARIYFDTMQILITYDFDNVEPIDFKIYYMLSEA